MAWYDILSVAAAFIAVGWLMKVVWSKDRDADRHAEDEARAFFDRHGVWPDEVKDPTLRAEATAPPRRSSGR